MTAELERDAERQPLLSPPPSKDLGGHVDPDEITPTKRKFIVFGLFLASFLSALDLTIVATCVPTISSELHLSNQGSWIGTAYLWSSVTFTPLYGRLSDIVGRRSAYLQASFFFGIGTFLCAIAPNLPFLAVSRFIAGMGGSGIGTVGSVIIADIFPPRDRGLFQSIFFIGFAAGMGSGGPIGGFVTKHFGWHAAFMSQIPFVLGCSLITAVCLPPSVGKPTDLKTIFARLDILGSFSLLLSIGSLLLALSLNANSNVALSDPRLIATLSSFVAFFILFVYIEIWVAKAPVLPLELLKKRTGFCVGLIAGLIAIVNFTMVYLVPTLYEIVFKQDLSEAGLHLVPNSTATVIGAALSGFIIRRTARYKWLTVISCLGPLTSMVWLTRLESTARVSQWLCLLPMGLGFASLLTATLIALLADVEKSQIATATGFVFVFRSIGQVSGVGLSQAVFQSSLTRELKRRFDDPELIERLRLSMESIYDLPPETQVVARAAFKTAIRLSFSFAAGAAFVCFVTSLFLKDKKLEDNKGA
ncbi:multidrug resistance protein fnx1 [Meredithblackwellia eburnea MCA 4105]